MNGIVSGGWNFVWGAYLITAAVMGTYAAWVLTKWGRLSREPRHGQQ